MTTVISWFWRDPEYVEYGPEQVNIWEAMLRRNTSIPIDVACVTAHPEGISRSVRIIDPPGDFEDYTASTWAPGGAHPQCFRRIALFRPDAAEVFGGDRLISMDLDCVIVANVDAILSRAEPIVMRAGSSLTMPYNGSLIMLDAGCRPEVWEGYTREAAEAASGRFPGSDQAYLAMTLGPNVPVVGPPQVAHAGHIGGGMKRRGWKMPSETAIVFFNGRRKPWLDPRRREWGFVREHYRAERAAAG